MNINRTKAREMHEALTTALKKGRAKDVYDSLVSILDWMFNFGLSDDTIQIDDTEAKNVYDELSYSLSEYRANEISDERLISVAGQVNEWMTGFDGEDVFVVSCDWFIDGNGGSSVKVFDSLEKAMSFMSKDYDKFLTEQGHAREDWVYEIGDTSIEAYKEYEALTDHCYWHITKNRIY